MSCTEHNWTVAQIKRVARIRRLDAILEAEYGVLDAVGRDCKVRQGDKPHNIYCAGYGTVAVPDRAISILRRRKALGEKAW